MKYLFLVLITFKFNLHAAYSPKLNICEPGDKSFYSSLLDCKIKTQGECIEVKTSINLNFCKIEKKKIDDLEKPIKVCEGLDAILDFIGFDENGCKITGYEKIVTDIDIVVIDEAKKAAYESAQAAKSQLESGISTALKRIEHGKRVIALLLVRNSTKSLTKEQVRQMLLTYSNIKDLLETGSLETAKQEIESITPDGSIVTIEDQNALVSEINSFLGI